MRKMKNYFKRGILLAGISILLWNCEKDSIPLIENQQNSIKSQEFVSFKELPVSLFNAVNEINPLTNAKYSEYAIQIAVDWDKILKVVDTLDNTKYSVRFRLKSDPKNVFYNLILGVDSNIPINPFILKYTIQNLSEIKKDNYLDLTKFKGTIETYNYQDFMQALSKNSKNKSMKTDLVGPYEPCSTTTFNGTQTGGGTSDSPSDGYNGPDSSVNYGYNDNLDTTTSSGGYSCNWMLVGGALQGDEFYWSLFINCGGEVNTAEKSSETPCPTTSGTIGINLPTLCDNGEPQDIYGNCFPPKIDQIIIDSSFENSKANCAYILLKDNVQFKSVLDKLIPSNSKYSVKFLVAPLDASGGKTNASYNPFDLEISVTINSFLVENRSIISVAESILHESVHARLFEMVKSINGLKYLEQFENEDSEIGKLAACFNKYKDETQHTFMWENYINIIAEGVESFHKLYPTDYQNFHGVIMKDVKYYNKETFYKDIARASLSKTSYFKELDSTQQKNILGLSSDLSINGKKIADYKTCK